MWHVMHFHATHLGVIVVVAAQRGDNKEKYKQNPTTITTERAAAIVAALCIYSYILYMCKYVFELVYIL